MEKRGWLVKKEEKFLFFTQWTDAQVQSAEWGVDAIPCIIDPPVERTYRVRFFLEARGNEWNTEPVGSHHATALRYIAKENGGNERTYFFWYVRAIDESEAIAKAKQLMRDSI